MRLLKEGSITSSAVQRVVQRYGTPAYIYDESALRDRCQELVLLKKKHSLCVRYAMKANSSAALLQIVVNEGLHIDASSLEEVERASLAGVQLSKILLTSQQVPSGKSLELLRGKIENGLLFNACSIGQLRAVAPIVKNRRFPVYVRVHPGIGSGESWTRNTGSNYSCFGVHRKDLQEVNEIALEHNIFIKGVHIHIGSGSNPEVWLDTAKLGVKIIHAHFQDADVLNLGGGFKTARMPDETSANIPAMVTQASTCLDDYYCQTGRKLKLEIEPGTFIAAGSGLLATKVMELKSTGEQGYEFVLLNSGMEANTRPLMYGSRHAFFILRGSGKVVHSDFALNPTAGNNYKAIVVGKCCETGDTQTIDSNGRIAPRKLTAPLPGDTFLIGGCGAYCSSMAPSSYNSSLQLQEILIRPDGNSIVIRKPQTLEQLIENEEHLPEFISKGASH